MHTTLLLQKTENSNNLRQILCDNIQIISQDHSCKKLLLYEQNY